MLILHDSDPQNVGYHNLKPFSLVFYIILSLILGSGHDIVKMSYNLVFYAVYFLYSFMMKEGPGKGEFSNELFMNNK